MKKHKIIVSVFFCFSVLFLIGLFSLFKFESGESWPLNYLIFFGLLFGAFEIGYFLEAEHPKSLKILGYFLGATCIAPLVLYLGIAITLYICCSEIF